MNGMLRHERALRAAAWLFGLFLAGTAGSYFVLRWVYTPRLDGQVALSGLRERVTVDSDALGVPTVRANSRLDALCALGYLTARDRLFQMDLSRRQSAGQLAEIFGSELLASDVRQRQLGMARAAKVIAAQLPVAQRAALEAYAQGVNGYLASAGVLPIEFSLLRYRPARWRAEDSVLVMLGMFQVLNGSEELERTHTIVAETLPATFAEFVLRSVDPYTEALLGTQAASSAPLGAALGALARSERAGARPRTLLSPRAGEARAGSNGWAVAGARTRDGRAIVANDMHLDLAVPNVWYRAELHYGEHTLSGVALPGVPLLVAGTNRHVAWGLTNLEGDVLDLVALELHPERANEYRTPSGYRPFALETETVKVRGEAERTIEIRNTVWGPVAARRLLGRQVAVRWTALDPAAVDLGLLELDRAHTIEDAAAIMNRAGMPPLNAMVGDRHGRIGWTVTGRIPRRRGFDGARSVSWADGEAGWEGYVEPDALPRLFDPSSGFLVNANQRMSSRAGDPPLGHDFGNGYRAYRIAERLRSFKRVSERDLFALQLDTKSALFEPYRKLALAALGAEQQELRRALSAWDGRAEASSLGFALLARFRRLLAERVFDGWFAAAGAAQADAEFDLADLDTPLTRALSEGPRELFAFARGGRDALLRSVLAEAAAELRAEHGRGTLDRLAWGKVSRVRIEHPLGALPILGLALNMPEAPLAGCGFCVRMASGTLGASERFVVSPGHEADGILHMPAGQSGSPFSPHYDDQQRAWVEGRPLPFAPGPAQDTLTLLPAHQPG